MLAGRNTTKQGITMTMQMTITKKGLDELLSRMSPDEAARRLLSQPALLAALKKSVANHCGPSRAFCSTCTPARDAIDKAEGR